VPFIAVLLITLLAGLAQVVMASYWMTPTPTQQSVFEAMGFAWKAGLGLIFSVFGGSGLAGVFPSVEENLLVNDPKPRRKLPADRDNR
jgi:hypothetical protein